MPTYDYKCNACGHTFEQFQSMKDKALKKCPSCGKNALERLIGTGAAVLFKGSGFYQTDYRSEGYKKAAAAETSKPADSSGSSQASSGGEAKPAPAPAKAAEPGKPAKEKKPKGKD
jgi:putative FmdB family regulatory protein